MDLVLPLRESQGTKKPLFGMKSGSISRVGVIGHLREGENSSLGGYLFKNLSLILTQSSNTGEPG